MGVSEPCRTCGAIGRVHRKWCEKQKANRDMVLPATIAAIDQDVEALWGQLSAW